MGSRPKSPEPTPEEIALEKRTLMGLREERARTERMLKAQARSKLGVKSLLGGIKPDTGMKQEDVVHSNAPTILPKKSAYDEMMERRLGRK